MVRSSPSVPPFAFAFAFSWFASKVSSIGAFLVSGNVRHKTPAMNAVMANIE